MSSTFITDFIFSYRYRIWRHVAFWFIYNLLTALIYVNYSQGMWSLQRQLFLGLLWMPARLIYTYPLMYWAIPRFLLKARYIQFGTIIFLWLVAGWFLNYLYRAYYFIPIQEKLHFTNIVKDPWMPGSLLLLTTAAGLACIIKLFKYWHLKQQELIRAEKEKITAELQLLKAQVHPHFLFNTLNNIYSFSLERSDKTPVLILKLSSLLSYMLYDCKEEKVILEKEIENMKNYTDLESVRYGNKLDISWNIEGDIKNKYISPLLMLPFLENAFKHGTSEQLEKPWLSFDLSVMKNNLNCKIANSKNEYIQTSQNGIGIENVKRRLGFLYPLMHELKFNDEGNFYVVSLSVNLAGR